MTTVVAPEELAKLSRHLAEASGEARRIRTRLEAVGGPLATVAALRVDAIEAAVETALEDLRKGAEVVLAVQEPD